MKLFKKTKSKPVGADNSQAKAGLKVKIPKKIKNNGKLKSSINLFKALEADKPKVDSRAKVMLIILGTSLAITIVSIIVVLLVNWTSQNKIAKLNEILNAPEVHVLLQEDEALKKSIVDNQMNMLLFNEMKTAVDGQSGFQTDIFHAVDNALPINVKIKSAAYADFQLTLLCESVTGNNPADFAKAVETTKVFEEVSYRGFTESSENNTVQFTLVCTLPGKRLAEEKAAADEAAAKAAEGGETQTEENNE